MYSKRISEETKAGDLDIRKDVCISYWLSFIMLIPNWAPQFSRTSCFTVCSPQWPEPSRSQALCYAVIAAATKKFIGHHHHYNISVPSSVPPVSPTTEFNQFIHRSWQNSLSRVLCSCESNLTLYVLGNVWPYDCRRETDRHIYIQTDRHLQPLLKSVMVW